MRLLKVRGVGRAEAIPDLIILSFGIESKEEDYLKCIRELDLQTDALRASLTKSGIDKTELKTTDFDVRIKTMYNEITKRHIFDSYFASQKLNLEFPNDKKLLNKIIFNIAHSNSGAEISLNFTVKDKERLIRKAMALAVHEAKENAVTLAKAAGVSLGKLHQIDYGWEEVRFSNNELNFIC